MPGDVSPERSGQRRAFRFAAGGPLMLDLPALSEHARKVEDLGFSTLFVSEHVGEQLAPLPAMMAAALATTRLRVGSLVFNAGHHNPVLLAQQAASADLLTSGRLEVGLGAGWYGPDYELMKLRFGSAAERIDQLAQTASIVRRLLSAESGGPPNADPAAASDSQRLASEPARLTPPPAQAPRVPLLIGGGGRRLLSVAARYADIIDIAPRRPWPGRLDLASVTAEATEAKLGWIAQAAPERSGNHELSVYPALSPPHITARGSTELRDIADRIRGRYPGPPLSVADLARSPHVLVGSADSVIEKLLGLREQFGISYVRVPHGAVEEFAPILHRLAGQ